MNPKTIVIITVSVLVTILLMKNTDQINFWFFGETTISKPAVLGLMFFTGAITGFLLGRPRKISSSVDLVENEFSEAKQNRSSLSDEDREYIS